VKISQWALTDLNADLLVVSAFKRMEANYSDVLCWSECYAHVGEPPRMWRSRDEFAIDTLWITMP